MNGSELLAKYLLLNGLTQGDFAMKCGVDQSTVSLWIDGGRCPRRGLRAKIESLTAGEVGRFSWLSDEEAARERLREEWMARTSVPVPLQALAARGWKS